MRGMQRGGRKPLQKISGSKWGVGEEVGGRVIRDTLLSETLGRPLKVSWDNEKRISLLPVGERVFKL